MKTLIEGIIIIIMTKGVVEYVPKEFKKYKPPTIDGELKKVEYVEA